MILDSSLIKEKLASRLLLQKELAEKVGISENQMSNILSGKKTSKGTARRIALYLKIPFGEIQRKEVIT